MGEGFERDWSISDLTGDTNELSYNLNNEKISRAQCNGLLAM